MTIADVATVVLCFAYCLGFDCARQRTNAEWLRPIPVRKFHKIEG